MRVRGQFFYPRDKPLPIYEFSYRNLEELYIGGLRFVNTISKYIDLMNIKRNKEILQFSIIYSLE
jgi:hypothetical protein